MTRYNVDAHASVRVDVDLGDGFIVDNRVGTRIWATTLTGRIYADGGSSLTARGQALTVTGMRGKRAAVCHALRLEDLPDGLQGRLLGAAETAARNLNVAVFG